MGPDPKAPMTRHLIKNLSLVLLLAGLALWLVNQFGMALNTNHSWLMIAAMRLLDGGTMVGDFFDPNPPLSILIYIPSALMAKYLFIPVFYAPYLFGLICLGFSILAVREILRYWPQPGTDGKTILLFAYIVANTLLTSSVYFFFGERDHLVIMGLYPFLLVQLSMNWRYDLPKWLSWPVLVFGAFAVLIKPHYGLLPVLILLHRMVTQKRFVSIVRDADFITLTGAVLAYIVVIFTLFPDYVSFILPEFLSFYLSAKNPMVPVIFFLYSTLILAALVLTSLCGVPFKKTNLTFLSLFAAAVCMGLFLLQMKGFYYHLIPAMVFFLTGLSLLSHITARHYFKENLFSTPVIVLLIFSFAYMIRPPQPDLLRHEDYVQTELGKLVQNCAPECTFFVFGENMELIHQVSLYSGATHASRFSSPMVVAEAGTEN